MDAQELRNLQEAYREVYTSPEELDEASRADEFTRAAIARNSGRKGGITFEPGPNWDPSANRGKGAHLSPKQKEKQRRKSLRQENVDLYDIILSHLLDEGYAETVEAAEVIMVNMSEEWRQDIMEISQRTATRAYAASKTGEFEGADSDRDIRRTDNLEKHIKRKFGDKAVKHAERAADAQTFGRKDASGRRKQTPQPRIQKSDYRTTQDGKMHKQDQRELKTDLRIKRDRRLRAARAADTED